MAKTCILVLTLAAAALGQTSADLSAKYNHVTAYKVRPDVLMTARFDTDGQVCEMTLEKRQTTDTGIVFRHTFSDTEVRTLMDDLVPENERGRNLTRVLNGVIAGGSIVTQYTYANVRVDVYGTARPAPAGDKVIIITWPKRACGEERATAR